MVKRWALTTKRSERYLRGSHMVEQGKTVLKMTLINFGKRPRWNLYSAYSKGRRASFVPSCAVYVGMQRNLYNFRYQASADARYPCRRHISPRVTGNRGSLSNWEKLLQNWADKDLDDESSVHKLRKQCALAITRASIWINSALGSPRFFHFTKLNSIPPLAWYLWIVLLRQIRALSRQFNGPSCRLLHPVKYQLTMQATQIPQRRCWKLHLGR